MYPFHTNYYLRILGIKQKIILNAKFLSGFTEPNMVFFYLQNRYWKDDGYFIISDVYKEIFFVFDIKQDELKIEFRPLDNSLEECQKRLTILQTGTAQDFIELAK